MNLCKTLLFTIIPWSLCVSTLHASINLGLLLERTKAQGQFFEDSCDPMLVHESAEVDERMFDGGESTAVAGSKGLIE